MTNPKPKPRRSNPARPCGSADHRGCDPGHGPFVRLVLAVVGVDLRVILSCAEAIDNRLRLDEVHRDSDRQRAGGASPSSKPTADAALPPMLVDRREAARLLGISPGTIDNLRATGELPSVKLMGRRLYDVADLSAFIAQRKTREGTS